MIGKINIITVLKEYIICIKIEKLVTAFLPFFYHVIKLKFFQYK